jgi:molybdenum cofactor cytidylyltransferase
MITGLILAAGLSKRMGKPKQGVLLAGRTMLDLSIEAFLSSSVDDLIVVVDQPQSLKRETGPRLRYVVNPDPSRGLSSSLKLGLRAVKEGSEAAVVSLGDKPLVLPETVDALMAAYRRTGARIVVPVYEGNRGNPVLFQRTMFGFILELSGDVGGRQVIDRHEHEVLELPVKDQGILLDIDTPSDIDKALALLASRDRSH